MSPQVTVRRVRADEWQQARCVRLASLADAPHAYSSTLAQEQAMSDAQWQARANANEAGVESCGFIAWSADVPCGFVVGVMTGEHTAALHALWVAGNIRRRGVGVALVQAVCSWARERGVQALQLEVTTSNHSAIALYKANGFEPEPNTQTTCGERAEPALRMFKRIL